MLSFCTRVTSAKSYVTLEKSAMGKVTKRSTLFQEALRRLRNISPSPPFTEAIPHMNEYANMLRISGYSHQYRYNLIKGAIERMKEIRLKVASTEWQSQYRDREMIMAAKVAEGDSQLQLGFLREM